MKSLILAKHFLISSGRNPDNIHVSRRYMGGSDARACVDRCFGRLVINSGRESILIELTFDPQEHSVEQSHSLSHFLEKDYQRVLEA